MNNLVRRAAPVMTLCLAAFGGAGAQGGTAPQPPASGPLQYRSAFADYKPWQDTRPGDWRALNDAVKGGAMSGMDMSSMKGTGDRKEMSNVPGVRGMAAHDAPMPVASKPVDAGHSQAPAKSASVPAMPDMPAHSGHDMKGGHQ
jgi:hypothetical protein